MSCDPQAAWRVVPCEPTDAMWEAAQQNMAELDEKGMFPDWFDTYRAMLSAAPAAPERQGDEAVARELAETLQSMVDEQVEYMTINNLGDPERQHNIKRARAALAAIRARPVTTKQEDAG